MDYSSESFHMIIIIEKSLREKTILNISKKKI